MGEMVKEGEYGANTAHKSMKGGAAMKEYGGRGEFKYNIFDIL
jgi:hypothetical protein